MKRKLKKFRMKSILCALLLVCVGTASLSGCSQNNAPSSSSSVVSEAESKTSEAESKTSGTESKTSGTESKTSGTESKASESESKTSETESKTSETESKTSETESKASETEQSESPVEASATSDKKPKAPESGYTINNVRNYVAGLDKEVDLSDGTKRQLINFDNAATTPALLPVEEAIENELEMYGSIGRGFSQKSNHSTEIYNNTREKVLNFLGADPEKYTCFYVNSTTDGLNKLASALIESEDDVVLATRMEHHANDLPWRERCNVVYAEVDDDGRIIYDDIERLLKENKVKYVTVTAASNVTGYVTDVHRVAKLAHQYGAKIIVDGAQIVAHRSFSMIGDTPEENIDFIAFSAHKMYSPYGGGAVVGLTDVLNKHMPEFYGGGTIKIVKDNSVVYKDAPASYEAGSPNYPGVVGLGRAIDILQEIGFDEIQNHEQVLNKKLMDGIKNLENVVIYGDSENLDDRVGVISFNFSDINSYVLAKHLSEKYGVATRRGAFCANPYVWRLTGVNNEETLKRFESCADVNTSGMIRISFGIYNTEEEIDEFLKIMPEAMAEARELQFINHGNIYINY